MCRTCQKTTARPIAEAVGRPVQTSWRRVLAAVRVSSNGCSSLVTRQLAKREALQLFCAPAATHALMIARSAAGIFVLPCGIAPLDNSDTNCDVFDFTLA